MLSAVLVLLVLGDAPTGGPPTNDACPECRAHLGSIQTEVHDLQSSTRWKVRDQAAADLAMIRWQCHPEVVNALALAVETDKKPKVRARAAEALGQMVPNLPDSHITLAKAAKSDPEPSVRKQSKKALAAKGLRCVVDCPICGPIPRGAAITGPSVLLPEWAKGSGPTGPKPVEPAAPSGLPPALPDPTP